MKTLLALILLFALLPFASAQQQSKIGVRLNITGKSGLEGQLRSFFAREFRAIGDVELGEGAALLAVNIVIMEPTNAAGQSLGYIMSLAVTDRTSVGYLALAGLLSTSDAEKQKQITKLVPVEGILVDHILQTLNSAQLQATCKALAAEIDGTHIERIRTQRREWQKLLESVQKK